MLSFLKTCEAVMADSSCWEAQQLLLVKLLLCLGLQVRVTRGKPGKQTILLERKNIFPVILFYLRIVIYCIVLIVL